jgi:hypothetical protein
MDSYYDDTPFCAPPNDAIRAAMGDARSFAQRIDLASSVPSGDLASSGYCLADPGQSYIVFVPGGGSVSVDLAGAVGNPGGSLPVEWLNPGTGETITQETVATGGIASFAAPFAGDAVLLVGGSPAPAPGVEPDPDDPPSGGAGEGDLNGDGLIDISDVVILIGAWGPCPGGPDSGGGCPADLNGDLEVGVDDVILMVDNWS